ncbi:S-adenosyl-L-methionine-dependent methyltransferase [Syncephalis plumigaleata]|nr:S-adenosyl-L-methionine-dependent methyltransferase [Syncephalis plumigaleata]
MSTLSAGVEQPYALSQSDTALETNLARDSEYLNHSFRQEHYDRALPDIAGRGTFPLSLAFAIVVGVPGYFALIGGYSFHSYLSESARLQQRGTNSAVSKYFTFSDPKLAGFYRARGSIPILSFVDEYLSGRITPSQAYSLLDIFEERHEWATFLPPLSQAHTLLRHWLDRLPWMDKLWPRTGSQDSIQLERAFYRGYLGNTSGQLYGRLNDTESDETLEQMQDNALRLISIHAARNHRSSSTAILIDSDALELATELAEKHNLSRGQVLFICAHYSTVAKSQYDKITWVNVPNPLEEESFGKLLQDIQGMLTDDGLLFLQAGGLRYSKPLHWYIQKLETAGFSVRHTENVSAHCATTFVHWYWNWEQNRDQIVAKYGERRWRIWAVYLAWAAAVTKQGTMPNYQFVAAKSSTSI